MNMQKIPVIRPIKSAEFIRLPDADGVSLTANPNVWTAFSMAISAYGWPVRSKLVDACTACNRRGEISVLPELKPTAFLVPRTHGRIRDGFLIKDLMDAVESMQIRKLHFAHFAFDLDQFPLREITLILEHLRDRNSGTTEIVFDIQCRHEADLSEVFEQVFRSMPE